ncbi:hypothetical protein QSJ18_18305 [Gordonia sp. ABSL1-1]|uniref:hypothetical protein n=1 Tax=Gordonia sp. ABSL1-1 TaxID=3053923 RepID=UPI0025732B8A|nr:hypothetical protein [Gordonia sp. ABSL1-1]MDL9938703.1 hypothetical protein [Gordonia sp. ABSL1-1]
MTTRTFGRVAVTIWRDRDFRKLSVDAQRCYLLLLSQRDLNHAGIQPLMIRKWAQGADATTEADILAALGELQAARFVCFDIETHELFVRSFIRNDGVLKQPNVLKSALKAAQLVDSERLRRAVADELRGLRRRDADAVADELDPGEIGNPYETLPEPFADPSVTLHEGLNPSGTLREGGGEGEGKGKNVTVSSYSPTDSAACVSERDADACAKQPQQPQQPSTEFDDGTPIPDPPADDDRQGPSLALVPAPTAIETVGRNADVAIGSAAATAVRLNTPAGIPRTVRDSLAREVQRLSSDPRIDRADIETAIREWSARPNAGPKLLPHLVADALRARLASRPAAETKATQRARATLAAGEALIEELRSQEAQP